AAFVLTLIGAVFAGLGVTLSFVQHVKVTTWLPVQATVTGTRIEEHRGSKGGRSYSPIVSFRYAVGGTEYSSHTVYPMSQSASHSWAASVVSHYPVGLQTTAYHDPGSPGRAYLVRESSIVPHVFAMIGLALLGGAWGLWAWGPVRGAEP